MEITKTEITIEIKLKSAMNVTAVYVDNLDNFKNAYSAVVTNHTQATVKEFGSVTEISIPLKKVLLQVHLLLLLVLLMEYRKLVFTMTKINCIMQRLTF